MVILMGMKIMIEKKEPEIKSGSNLHKGNYF